MNKKQVLFSAMILALSAGSVFAKDEAHKAAAAPTATAATATAAAAPAADPMPADRATMKKSKKPGKKAAERKN